MESFEINVNGTILTVLPQEYGTFRISWNGKHYCTVFADVDINTAAPIWSTGDLVSMEEVKAIGEAIEHYDNYGQF